MKGILFLAFLGFSSSAFAEKLQNGCVFNNFNNDFYQVTSKDKHGRRHVVYWPKKCGTDRYTNIGPSDWRGEIMNSQAVDACRKQKLYLPSEREFEALKNCFEKGGYPDRLSDKGFSDLVSKIPSLNGDKFWTSTSHDQSFAVDFDGWYAGNAEIEIDWRYVTWPVCCVGR